jgi:uncharacterized membrane protein (UPF0127 family)
MASFLSPLLSGAEGARFGLVNARTQAMLADRLVPAFDSATRRVGLLKHTSLPDGEGLVLAPGTAIHTFFMRFSIDVAFVARSGRVVKARHALKPWRMSGALRAFAVVELPAGTLARTGTQPGDTVIVVPIHSNGPGVSAS